MKFSLIRHNVLVIAAALLAAGLAHAQTRTGSSSAARPTQSSARPTTSAGNTMRNVGGTGSYGGGYGGASSRQYLNSTMVGDAMITSDMETRRLIIVTDDETNENIKAIIKSLDKPKPQVLINVVFVQVTHDKDLDIGAEATWTDKVNIKGSPNATGTSATKFGIADQMANPLGYGAFYRLTSNDINATLHALAVSNKTEILSRPSILTRSAQQATIMVGQSVPIITNTRISDTTNTQINTVQYQDVGIILRVTPFITQDGLVEMIVSPEISSLSATTVPISANVNSPAIDRRSADTVVVTKTDQTIVIGGLISTETKDKDSKVPILGDIPILGYAFKHKEKSTAKTELLVFLTPHVVNSPDELGGMANEERAKLDMTTKSFEQEDMKRYLGAK